MPPRKRKAAASAEASGSTPTKKTRKAATVSTEQTGKVKQDVDSSDKGNGASRLIPFGQVAAVSALSGRAGAAAAAAASSSSTSASASNSSSISASSPLAQPFTIQPSIELLEALRKDVDDLFRKVRQRQRQADEEQAFDIPPFGDFLEEWVQSGWEKMGLVLGESRPGRMEALHCVNRIFCEHFARLGQLLAENESRNDGHNCASPLPTSRQAGRKLLHSAIIALYALYALHAAPLAKAAGMVEPGPSSAPPASRKTRSVKSHTIKAQAHSQGKGKRKANQEDDEQQDQPESLADASKNSPDARGCISLAPITTWAEDNLLPRIRYQRSTQGKGRLSSEGTFPLPQPHEAVPHRIHPDEGRIQIDITIYSDVILRLPDLAAQWFPSPTSARRTRDRPADLVPGGLESEIAAVDEMTFILLTLCGPDHGQGWFRILMSPGASATTPESSLRSRAHNLTAAQQAAADVLRPLHSSSSTFASLHHVPLFVGGFLVVSVGEGQTLYIGLSRGETIRWTATERSCPSPEFLREAVTALLRDRAAYELATGPARGRHATTSADKDKAAAETAALSRWSEGDITMEGEAELWVDLNLVVEAERVAARRAREVHQQSSRVNGDAGGSNGMAFAPPSTEITFAGSLARQLAGDQLPSTSNTTSASAALPAATEDEGGDADQIQDSDDAQATSELDQWTPPQNLLKGRFVRLPDSVLVGAKAQADDIMAARHRGQNVGDMLMAEGEGVKPTAERSDNRVSPPAEEPPVSVSASPTPPASASEVVADATPELIVVEAADSPPRVRTLEAPWAGTRLTSTLLHKLPPTASAERERRSPSFRESGGTPTMLSIALGSSARLTPGGSTIQAVAGPASYDNKTESHRSPPVPSTDSHPAAPTESSIPIQPTASSSPVNSRPSDSLARNDSPKRRGRPSRPSTASRQAAAAAAAVQAELDNTLEDVMVEARRRTVKVLERTGLREV
ncbi:hypothetical protein OC846_001287 [Tilletia horrida]|uniref:Uncharacterized protein n=1 Tax=Tilletia horrida TaxID=155126 RepID=A0AAN6GZ42_9BASI|nr:hypothetical protein OC845_001258 [Tilletia horrida]KAK0556193.1 hypothetical protein OC846_001287 [Tilletia horrida]KAK0569144.1 hypothetical protein OC861_001284 [Tilletia horrida]